MKTKTLVLSLTVIVLFLSHINLSASNSQPVNSILGDISFFNKFGSQPDNNTDETIRIKTHLDYVEDLLRSKNTSGLSAEMIAKRNHLFDILHEYLIVGIFPRNYDYKEQRIPCFIDSEGRICAVGYLIERTSGRQTAERINSKHKYELIIEMNDEAVDMWIANSGLTKEECAMIQPSYEYLKRRRVSTSNIVLSSTLTAANLTLNTINAIELSNERKSLMIPIIGLISGTAQVILGAVNYPSNRYYELEGNTANDSKKILSAANIGIGASTIILSIWNILNKEKTETKKTSWNIYSFPAKENIELGFSLTHKF